MRSWSFREAESRLDVVVDCAHDEGPQIVERDEGQGAVVMSEKDFKALLHAVPNLGDFVSWSPLDREDLPDRVKARVHRDDPLE